MKSETEILGDLDTLFAQLDDAAKARAIAFLASKYVASAASYLPPVIVVPQQLPPTIIERDPRWPGTLEITCAKLDGEPRTLTPRDLTAQGYGASIQASFTDWVATNETRPDASAYGFRPLQ